MISSLSSYHPSFVHGCILAKFALHMLFSLVVAWTVIIITSPLYAPIISMTYGKTTVSPLMTHWWYCSLALNHRYAWYSNAAQICIEFGGHFPSAPLYHCKCIWEYGNSPIIHLFDSDRLWLALYQDPVLSAQQVIRFWFLRLLLFPRVW